MHLKITRIITTVLVSFSLFSGLSTVVPCVVYADTKDNIDSNMQKVLGNSTNSKDMSNLLKNGTSLVTNGGTDGSDNLQIGENISKLDANDKCVALRLVLFNRGTDALATIQSAGITAGAYNSYTTATKKSTAADTTDIAAGVLSLGDFMNLMGSGFTEKASVYDIGLVASIDQSKNNNFLASGTKDTLAVYKDSSKDKVTNPNFVVARLRNSANGAYGDVQTNFTMVALYQIANAGLKSGLLKTSEYLCVDMYGNIVTSEGNLILPYFMNSSFVSYPSACNKFMSYVQAGEGYLSSAAKDAEYADLMNTLGDANRGSYYSYPMFMTFAKLGSNGNSGGGNKNAVSLIVKKVGSNSLLDEIESSWNLSVSTLNTDVMESQGTGDDFSQYFLMETGQPVYENEFKVGESGSKSDYNVYYMGNKNWLLFNKDFFEKLFAKSGTKYKEFYGVMYADNQVLLPVGCGNDVLVGQSSAEKSITDKITDTLDDPYTNSVVPMFIKWTTSAYQSFLQGVSGNDTVQNIIVYTANLADSSIFTYYSRACFMIANVTVGGLLLITAFKKLRTGNAGTISEVLTSIALVYMCIMSPVYAFPYILEYGFDRPSMLLLSNLINDSFVETLNSYYASVDGVTDTSSTSVSAQALATQLDYYVMKPYTASTSSSSSSTSTTIMSARTFINTDKLAKLSEYAVSLRFNSSTDTDSSGETVKLKLSSDLKITPKTKLDKFTSNSESFDVSSALQDTGVSMKSLDSNGKTITNVVDPFYVYEIVQVYADNLRTATVSQNNTNLKYPSYYNLVKPSDGTSGNYDSNGINQATVDRIVTRVNIKLFDTFTDSGKNLYSQLNIGAFVRIAGLYIAEEIDAETGADCSRMECTSLTTDDFMQGLFMPRAVKIAYNTRNSTGLSKSAALINYINEKTTVGGLLVFNVFIVFVALYGLARSVLLLFIVVVGSIMMILAYPFERDFRNKAFIGVIISIGILALSHIGFLFICRLCMLVVNL